MTDERWEELMRQIGGLLQREDVDCAHRMLQDLLTEQIRQQGEEDPTVAATRVVLRRSATAWDARMKHGS